MNLHITKSKNSESFYICKSYVKANGSTSSMIVRKLGTLEQLLAEHGPTRDDVLAWAKNEVKIETEKYKREKEAKTVLIPFHADRQLDYDKQVFYRGGYLFLQSIYYQMQMNKICRKLKQKYKFDYDINAILSDLIYTRILEPCSKRSSYKAASEFLEKPSYELHDVYRALDVLGAECDLIQAEVYKKCFAISVCPSEGVESPTVVGAQAANELLDIVGMKASVVLTPYEGKIYISARSIDEVNVQVMMEKLGGGGHRTIAGAQLPGATVEEAKEKVKGVIDMMLEKGEI